MTEQTWSYSALTRALDAHIDNQVRHIEQIRAGGREVDAAPTTDELFGAFAFWRSVTSLSQLPEDVQRLHVKIITLRL